MTSPRSHIVKELESWYCASNGQYVLQYLRQSLEGSLDTAFGYHILQLGVSREQSLLECSSINHRIYAAQQPGEAIGLVAQGEELPLESDSIDILIAHHALEFDSNPHQVLREMQRVLAPQGHLVIIGFNPYSAFGATAALKGLSRRSAWHQHHPVSRHRLSDWLHLLGCEVQACSYLYAVPPLGGGRLRQYMIRCDHWLKSHNVPIGGVYVLHAIKQVTGANRPRRSLLSPSERLMGLAVPKPRAAPSPTPSIHLPGNGDVAA